MVDATFCNTSARGLRVCSRWVRRGLAATVFSAIADTSAAVRLAGWALVFFYLTSCFSFEMQQSAMLQLPIALHFEFGVCPQISVIVLRHAGSDCGRCNRVGS